MSYDAYKLENPEDAGFYRFESGRRSRRLLRCFACGATGEGLYCEECGRPLKSREETP